MPRTGIQDEKEFLHPARRLAAYVTSVVLVTLHR